MSASIIKRLQRRKDDIFNAVKDLENYLASLGDPLSAGEIATLKLYVEDITPMHSAIEVISDELFEQNIDIAAEVRNFKRNHREFLGKAQGLINTVTPPPTPDVTTPSPYAESQPIRLPAVDIPVFSGDYEKWTTFRDSFISLIHKNASLSKVQKFHYLQGALKGEAASILKCLSVSDEGYEIAWERLQKRYQNERFLVKRYVKTLLNLPDMKRGDHISLRHLIDTVSITLTSLLKLNRPADQWDDLLIEIVPEKLDAILRKEWEGDTCEKIPSYEKLESFLTMKCKQLEAIKNTDFTAKDNVAQQKAKVNTVNTVNTIQRSNKCLNCNGEHSIYKCFKFNKLSVSERNDVARKKQLCFNCLGKGHSVSNCASSTCRKCNKRHHTLLHPDEEQSETNTTTSESAPDTQINLAYFPSKVLLSTCQVIIKDDRGREEVVRVLLDSGAQANLITDSCVKRLGLRRFNLNTIIPIVGVGENTERLSTAVSTKINSRLSNFNMPITALIIEKITTKTPSQPIKFDTSIIPAGIQLADPTFYEPHSIDMLIGNKHYQDILTNEHLKMKSLSLFNTHFGWIIYGELPYKNEVCQNNHAIVLHVGLNDMMSKFWEIECHKQVTSTPAENRCEEHFQKHTKRDITGRFVVALPFNQDPSYLGNSSTTAKHRFLALERRLIKSPEVYVEYRNFMQEYQSLGHMKKTCGDITTGYYLPNHCVVKQSSLTTKLRVVFNDSAPTLSGVLLNDILMVGPTIQNNLFSIMSRMRHLECKSYFYTDSTITLSWIKADFKKFKTFVSNRVGEIQKSTNPDDWLHVSTRDNSADLISRGSTAACLRHSELWWKSPEFLLEKKYTARFIPDAVLPEAKCNVAVISKDNFIIPECSTFEKTVRVIAYVVRFKDYLKKRDTIYKGPLTISELNNATIVLLKKMQSLTFHREIELLKRDLNVSNSSKLVKLNPFLDSKGLIRVGGRLANSNLNNDRCFPMVIPANHRLTKLIVTSVHKSNLHIGTQGTLAAIRLKYWILNGRGVIRGVLSSCMNCIRAKPQFKAPLMAPLTPHRVQQARPLIHSGVDYCGPFIVKEGGRRSTKLEAAVKSVKTHLHRVAGKALLIVDELGTLLTQIEAVLNSRPLCPLSNDPNDFSALTPAHFLIGDVLTTPVEADFSDTPTNRLARWQMIQKLRQHIWKRWSKEYLSELHTRRKWTSKENQLQEGQLVIVKEDNIPALQWQLGRIEELHRGPDGIARSATIRTSRTRMVRPIVKLCVLLQE